MKKIYIYVVTLFIATSLYGQTPTVNWNNSFGGSNRDYSNYIQQTNDSGYIVIGRTYSDDSEAIGYHGDEDVFVVKISKTGTWQWSKCYGGSNIDQGNCIIQTTDGGYIFTGWTASTDGDITDPLGSHDAWVVKIDDTGKIMWAHNYGVPLVEQGYFIQSTLDGGYIVVGDATGNSGEVTGYHGGTVDVWTFKINDTGTLLWEKCYGGSNSDGGGVIYPTQDSGFIIGAVTASSNGDVTFNHGGTEDYWIIKVNDTGGIIWQRTYGGTGDDEISSICLTNNHGYAVSGYSNSTDDDVVGNHGGYDYWTLDLNDTGGIIWAKCYGGSADDWGNYIQQTADKGFLMIGSILSTDGEVTTNYGEQDIWLVKTDSNGNLEWQKNYGGDSIDAGSAFSKNFDSTITILCWTRSVNHDVSYSLGSADIWVANLDISALAAKNITPDENIIIYPNPASNFFVLQTPESNEPVALTLYDVLGNSVPINHQTSAQNKYIFNASSGIYIVKIANYIGSTYRKIVIE